MVSSKEAIEYIKNNIDENNLVSMFVAGSLPNELTPKTDLDIFFVIKDSKKDDFFENLSFIMNKFIAKYKGITYTFFRGPIKYKNKGLIQCLIYTETTTPDFNDREQFVGESRHILKSLISTAEVIKGKSLLALTKGIDWSNIEKAKEDIDNMKRKYSLLQEKNKISYPEWKKTKNGWRFLRTNKYVSKFLKEYLSNYYSKNIAKVT